MSADRGGKSCHQQGHCNTGLCQVNRAGDIGGCMVVLAIAAIDQRLRRLAAVEPSGMERTTKSCSGAAVPG